MLVTGALLVRAAAEGHSVALGTVAIPVGLAALLMFGVGWHRQRSLVLGSSPPAPHSAVLVLVVVTVWMASAAAALSLLE